MTSDSRIPPKENRIHVLRLPDTRAFFDIFNARTSPADALMVSAVGLLGVWVRHYETRKLGHPMSQRLAYLMDLHIWAIDRYVEDLLETACHRPAADAEEMHYSYDELVSLLTADFVRCRREERQPGGITEDQVLHHVRHWDGFNAMVDAVAAGRARPKIPRNTEPAPAAAESRERA
ncbi:hypothetical protein U3653_17055 [Nocardia sp. CDC186]|uniref:Uncharacterized protein n=1 Tax=Nocardia implantans TaxID=3108168 RepID=A0ABU6AW77_9NOCA|nr:MULTISPECIES: hypothetical protein [unclassified Nocardia]MBF6192888.1 hypothetical protein [Nocardia beijingensis]MEA3531394.1 hypothetical protein [Nocardia sp. CDC192]MEB3511741.1 hypothetical protein [Nocardia sp. CDC186]